MLFGKLRYKAQVSVRGSSIHLGGEHRTSESATAAVDLADVYIKGPQSASTKILPPAVALAALGKAGASCVDSAGGHVEAKIRSGTRAEGTREFQRVVDSALTVLGGNDDIVAGWLIEVDDDEYRKGVRECQEGRRVENEWRAAEKAERGEKEQRRKEEAKGEKKRRLATARKRNGKVSYLFYDFAAKEMHSTQAMDKEIGTARTVEGEEHRDCCQLRLAFVKEKMALVEALAEKQRGDASKHASKHAKKTQAWKHGGKKLACGMCETCLILQRKPERSIMDCGKCGVCKTKEKFGGIKGEEGRLKGIVCSEKLCIFERHKLGLGVMNGEELPYVPH